MCEADGKLLSAAAGADVTPGGDGELTHRHLVTPDKTSLSPPHAEEEPLFFFSLVTFWSHLHFVRPNTSLVSETSMATRAPALLSPARLLMSKLKAVIPFDGTPVAQRGAGGHVWPLWVIAFAYFAKRSSRWGEKHYYGHFCPIEAISLACIVHAMPQNVKAV